MNSAENEDPTFDVIVVGFGGAGACAAIAAADAGASVLVLDRAYGGGSTYHSGGVVYAGGGTRTQREADVPDTPDNMFAYLKQETAGVVTDETLRRFADGSPEMIEWLEAQGLEFEGSVCPYKTSYPTNRHYLYYSGNELATGYSEVATPAPRGHRTRAKNFSGATYYGKLRDSALAKGVTFRPLAQAKRLIVEDDTVVGVEFLAPDLTDMPTARFRNFSVFAAKMAIWYPPLGDRLNRIVERDRLRRSKPWRARARGGVILATGGHGFDKALMAQHAPAWVEVPPLGTIGDDGAALALASPVNASTGRMESISGWRFIAPPSAFMEGIVVNKQGARIANEQLYGATQTKPLIEEHGGTGFLIVGADTWRKARSQLRTQTAFFHAPQMAYLFSPFGHRKAGSLRALAGKIGVDPDGLERTASSYNAAIGNGDADQFGKTGDFRHPLATGPFYAINLSPNVSSAYPLKFITLGGLVVDEGSGQVVSTGGKPIPGLYAAGRSAVGICSNSYVSGLSLADGVFSGRRAGEHAAAQLSTTTHREIQETT
ncbi:succinate dehydrogenase [Nocardia nova]|uniref:Succinate dehydrogenase n=1 Tax=Nocardia nova TaxID=37330 RepID=A0A2S6AN33_9NOCA|nr:FAD-binding protein [Nocardia nova]PPJ25743.1 succinate dehydrogenase [Nocardia nova]PPJ36628.1 succinate dehydrogenase [Nocardia nova]